MWQEPSSMVTPAHLCTEACALLLCLVCSDSRVLNTTSFLFVFWFCFSCFKAITTCVVLYFVSKLCLLSMETAFVWLLRPRRTHPCSPGSGLWSQLARQAARRQEVVSEWGPLPRQDVSGLGRRRRGAQVQLGGAVQARWRPGSDPRPQPGMEECNDI